MISLAELIARSFGSLAFALEGDDDDLLAFAAQLGYELTGVPPSLRELGSVVAQLVESTTSLGRARVALETGAGATITVAEAAALVAVEVGLVAMSLHGIGARLGAELPPSLVLRTGIDRDFERRLYDFGVIRVLDETAPLVRDLLILAGVVELVPQQADEARSQPEFELHVVHARRLAQLVREPEVLFREVYGWGTSHVDTDRLFENLLRLSFHLEEPARYGFPPPELLRTADAHTLITTDGPDAQLHIPLWGSSSVEIGVVLFAPPPPTEGGAQPLAATLVASGQLSADIEITRGLSLKPEIQVDIRTGLIAVLRPGQDPILRTDAYGDGELMQMESGRAAIELASSDFVTPDGTTLLSLGGGSRITAKRTSVALGADVVHAHPPDVFLEARIEGGQLQLSLDEADGFLSRAIPAKEIRAEFDLALRWSTLTGVSFGGSGTLESVLAVGKTLGPARIETVTFRLGVDERLRLETRVAGTVRLGPVIATIEDIGAFFDLGLEPGNFGPISAATGVLAPTGLGVAIEVGPVSGAGFLTHDAIQGRYAGNLQLETFGLLLSALGIVDTKLPDGTKGFSFVAVVSAEFQPVQIGFGFTLNGVGGLVGVHRRVDTEAMRAALRGPGLGDIFFAEDPVAHAARLLGDLVAYFPAAEGRYVFGPAVKIGWGTPTIVEGELAILLEVPAPVRIVLLGNVRTALPTKDRPIIELNVDVVGEVDFARKTVAVDASLRDSKVAGFALTGDMAFRMSWGDAPSFVLSVGGFHSQFRTPPGFPALRRVRISIGADEDPRLDIQGFLALTSNTLQVGAQVDLYASAGPLNVMGTLGFETLIQFSPFSFQVDLWAGVALRRNSTVLASVHLDGRLTGPSPWRIVGQACLSLWFVDLCVDFDATFGRADAAELPRREIWPELEAALVMPGSWSTALPRAGAQVVVTAPPVGEGPAVRIDPAAALTVRQKVVPLNRTITRFAQAEPEGAGRFDVTQVKVGTAGVPFQAVTDWFAPAQFEVLSDAERLSRDGYEPMVAGVTVASDAVSTGPALTKALGYETILLRGGERVPMPGEHRPTRSAQIASTALGANATAPLRRHVAGAPPRVRLDEEQYVITSTMDLSPRLDIVGKVSRGEAELALKAYVKRHPVSHGDLQVVPLFEVEELVA